MQRPSRTPATLIAALSIACFASSLTIRMIDPLVPLLAREFAAAPVTMSQATAAFLLPYALAQVPLGLAGDRLGKLLVIRWSLAALTVLTAALSLATTIEAFALLRAAGGLASAAIVPMALAAIGDTTTRDARSRVISIAVFGILAGMLVGVAAGAHLAETLGWQAACLIASVICAMAWGGVSLFERSQPTPKAEPRRYARDDIRAIFRHPACTLAYLGVFIDGACVFGLTPHLATRLEQAGLGGPSEAGLMIAAIAAGGILFTIAANVSPWLGSQSRMSLLGASIAATSLASLPWASSLASLFTALTTLGIGFYMLHNVLQTLATELSAEARGVAVSLHAFFFFAGQAAGPTLYAYGFAHLGPSLPVLIAATLMLSLGFAGARRG